MDGYIVEEYYYTYDKLVNDLIGEIKRDTLENSEDHDLVARNMELLEKVYSKKSYSYENEKFIIKELELFGYSIYSVRDLKDSLLSLKYYLNANNYETLGADTEHLRKEIIDIFK